MRHGGVAPGPRAGNPPHGTEGGDGRGESDQIRAKGGPWRTGLMGGWGGLRTANRVPLKVRT